MALRNYILDNFWWKLLSLLLAALTWLTIWTAFERAQTLQESPVLTSSVRIFQALPITLMTAVTNANRYDINPKTVSVEVAGSESDLEKLRENEIHLFVDITDIADEKQVHRKIEAQTPRDVRIIRISENSANVERIGSSRSNFNTSANTQ